MGKNRDFSKVSSKIEIFLKISTKIEIARTVPPKLRFLEHFEQNQDFLCINLDFIQLFRKISILDFGFQKILIFAEIVENRDFSPYFWEMSLRVEIVEKSWIWSNGWENLDFHRNLRKFQFRNSRFWSKFLKVSILCKLFEKPCIWLKFSKNTNFGKNFEKYRIWSEVSKI